MPIFVIVNSYDADTRSYETFDTTNKKGIYEFPAYLSFRSRATIFEK